MYLIDQIRSSIFVQSIFKLAGGTSIAHLITIGISPILTRIYPADAFGELQLFHSSIILASIIVTGTYEMLIVTQETENEAIEVFKLSVWLNLFFLLLLSFPALLLTEALANYFQVSFLTVLIFPITLFLHSFIKTFEYWFLRSDRYELLSGNKIIQSAGVSLSQLGVGYKGMLSAGLITGYTIGRLIALFGFLRSAGKELLDLWKKVPAVILKKTALKYRDQPLHMVPAILLSTGGIEIPILLIGILFGQIELGYYALAYRVLSAPAAFIGTSVGQVFYKQAADRRNNQTRIFPFLRKTWVGLTLIAIIPMTAIFFYAEPLFGFIFGAEWVTAGAIASILTPLLFIDFISAPTGKTLIVLDDQKYMPRFSILISLSRISGIAYGYWVNDFFAGLSMLVLLHIMSLLAYNVFLMLRVLKYDKSIVQE